MLPDTAKAKIRDYTLRIRNVIDESDMPEATKSRLLKQLADFEAALEKRRLPLMALILFVMGILTFTRLAQPR